MVRGARLCSIFIGLLPGLASASPPAGGVAPSRSHELFGFYEVGEAAGRSQDGMYSFRLDASAGEEQVRIVVRQRGREQPLARINPNRGGATRNIVVRFVGEHNLLASWSCGTYCALAALFSPTGQKIASFGIHELSPNAALAVSYNAFSDPFGSGDDEVSVIDLRTGTMSASKHAGAWNTCKARWQRERVTLLPCDARTQPVLLPLSFRGRK